MLVAFFPASLTESGTPDSPQVTLVCSTFSPPQPRVICYKQNFVSWLFKRMPVFPADFVPGGQKSHCFSQPDVMSAPLPGSSALCWELGLGLRPHVSQVDPLSQLRHPFRNSAAVCENRASHFCISALSNPLDVAFFCKSLVIRFIFS